MPYDSALTICVLAGHASARPGGDIHSVGGDSASDASVVDDMDRSAAAVAGESEGSGIDLCVFLSPSTARTRAGPPESAVAVRR